MRKFIKFGTDKETDNIETLGADQVIRDFFDSLKMPFDGDMTSIEGFEFKRRDGFIPHSHNRGGFDLFTQTTVSRLMGSGEHFGTAIEQWTEDSWDEGRKHVKESSPELDPDSDEFYDATYSACSGDYDGIAWRVRVMYEGNGKLSVFAGYDTDAPYYRFSGKFSSLFEQTITFKTLSGLERQLQRMVKKLEASQDAVKTAKLKKGA